MRKLALSDSIAPHKIILMLKTDLLVTLNCHMPHCTHEGKDREAMVSVV